MSRNEYRLTNQGRIFHPSISKDHSIEFHTDPFNYIVIDNFLNKDTYEKASNKFPNIISRATQYKNQKNATSQYEGYITGLGLNDCTEGYEIFSSLEFKNFISNIFDIELNQYIAPSAHFHKSPSKNGFAHRDLVICSFVKNDRDIAFHGGCEYTDDSNSSSNNIIKTVRSIAFLYYLNNPIDLMNKDKYTGGGTAIFESSGNNIIKEVAPVNNRLFAFEMSYNSYHAFVGANFDRSCLVSWFHSSPAYFLKRHFDKYIEMKNQNRKFIETWRPRKPEEYWNIENDPNYSLYFSKPLKDYE
jgi:Rps23 Pro-64 3,4-dihydroxylase Tpa1-like proline 4-hydroxylase